MPFKSRRQQRYFYANRKKLERQGVDVGEWSGSTDYENLPERKKPMNKKTATIQPPQEAQSRLQTLLSSPQYQYARTGALVGGGASLLRALLQNRGLRDTIGSGLASAGMGAGAGLGLHALGTGAGYNMPHRKTAALKKAFTTIELATVLPLLVGAGAGAVRSKDKGESRLRAILRSGLTGASTSAGAVAGTLGGVSLPGRLGSAITPLGTALGGAGGYLLARRRPQEKTAALKQAARSRLLRRAALLGRKANRVIDPGGFGASMVPGRSIVRRTLGLGGYGAGVGGVVGAARQKDEGESRLGAILRSALTGGAVGSGIGGGASLGTRAGLGLITRGARLAPLDAKGIKELAAPVSVMLAGASAPYAGGALGGIGGYRLARRRPQEKTAASKQAFTLSEAGILAPFLFGGTGAAVGAARSKDKGESRLGAILRSALTGASTGVGTAAGSIGGLLAGEGARLGTRSLGAIIPLGGALGGIGGYRLARRRPQEKTSAARRLIIRKTVERAVHGH